MNNEEIRSAFPITKVMLKPNKDGISRKLVYLDHAASTHPPKQVLDIYLQIMQNTYANVHRGEHELSEISTEMFEEVPQIVSKFLGINNLENSGKQVVFSSNTTSSLDMASHLFSNQDGITLTSVIEHHSNDLPHRRRGKTIHYTMNDDGTINMDDLENKLSNNKVKLVAITGGSNVTGFMPDIHKVARLAHDHDAKILVDAAQRLAHYPIDVKPLDHPEHLDFVAAAGHKTYAPFGSSFLLGTSEIFDNAPPYIPSGGTVSFVTEDDIVFLKGTDRHTYGTPNIAGTIAFGKSIQFLSEIGMDYIRDHELHLLKRLLKGMKELSNVEIYGDFPLNQKLGVVTFNINGMRHNHVSQLLNEYSGIATRNGCFCAHPYIARLLKVSDIDATKLKDAIINGENPELPGAVRASIGLYNNEEEIDLLIETLSTIINNPKNTKNSVTVSVN